MMRSRIPPSQLPSSPHVVARRRCTAPGPQGIARVSPLAILRVVGAQGPGCRLRGAVSAGWAKSRDFAAGGRRALLELPAATANASARPSGFSYAVAIRINRQASPSEVETTETAASDFFGWAAAPSGLRLPPPSLGSWKTRKNT